MSTSKPSSSSTPRPSSSKSPALHRTTPSVPCVAWDVRPELSQIQADHPGGCLYVDVLTDLV
eukprot:20344-Eustigmatos_ZCMA.PRE.1